MSSVTLRVNRQSRPYSLARVRSTLGLPLSMNMGGIDLYQHEGIEDMTGSKRPIAVIETNIALFYRYIN